MREGITVAAAVRIWVSRCCGTRSSQENQHEPVYRLAACVHGAVWWNNRPHWIRGPSSFTGEATPILSSDPNQRASDHGKRAVTSTMVSAECQQKPLDNRAIEPLELVGGSTKILASADNIAVVTPDPVAAVAELEQETV
ncbi:hypothetical protein NDU88_001687 [Pleurodeles waltl]|uniref:Uncharacterized protein n=1 Tax=Pleurodeles waltl TaxID=8319 RepID=A0AAV7MNE0_PLEWA|nr:hypothetical protein NDU88_001687 [Pleurodeles waltl]